MQVYNGKLYFSDKEKAGAAVAGLGVGVYGTDKSMKVARKKAIETAGLKLKAHKIDTIEAPVKSGIASLKGSVSNISKMIAKNRPMTEVGEEALGSFTRGAAHDVVQSFKGNVAKRKVLKSNLSKAHAMPNGIIDVIKKVARR